MQAEDRVAVEPDPVGLVRQHFDGGLVVEDHLGLAGGLAFGHFAEFEQAPGFEQGIGVALEAAGVPGQIDDQAAHDVPQVGSGRQVGQADFSGGRESGADRRAQVGGLVGPIVFEEGGTIPDGFPARFGLADVFGDRGAFGAEPGFLGAGFIQPGRFSRVKRCGTAGHIAPSPPIADGFNTLFFN